MADVERDYFKVFSDRYPNDLSSIYIDNGNGVYAFSGGRGSDLYYSASKIVSLDSKNDGEIFFTVENYYDGSDFSSEPYTQTDTFSVVTDGNTWKAGKFTLPY